MCVPYNYSLTTFLRLTSLAERRRITGIEIFAGLLNNNIDSPDLLSLVCFKVISSPSSSTGTPSMSHIPPSTIWLMSIMSLQDV